MNSQKEIKSIYNLFFRCFHLLIIQLSIYSCKLFFLLKTILNVGTQVVIFNVNICYIQFNTKIILKFE